MLKGKRGLILGVANKRSIAWAITRAANQAGAELALTYAGERFREGVAELAEPLGVKMILPCDVSSDAEITSVFARIRDTWGGLDFLVHSIAFARKDELNGRFLDTSRDGYLLAQEISSYSLTALCRAAAPLMAGRCASVLTLTYLGGERVVRNYNVMGVAKAALQASVRYLAWDLGSMDIRVNAISAGPIKTLSAAGVSEFSSLLEEMPRRAPLRRNVTAEEVADAALFFLSPLSRSVTGEILFVDCGFNILGI